jgi:transcriptional regulator of arginine metabolism
VNKSERHAVILRLVREREIYTQEELAQALGVLGFEVVQTTVSRDIAELGLVKARSGDGKLVYAPPSGLNGNRRHAQLAEAFKRWALSCEANGSLVLVTTPPGFAGALAQEIDEARHPGILGTLAGENTILIVARVGISGDELCRQLREELLGTAAIEARQGGEELT